MTRVKTMITTGCDCGSAEWIKREPYLARGDLVTLQIIEDSPPIGFPSRHVDISVIQSTRHVCHQ